MAQRPWLVALGVMMKLAVYIHARDASGEVRYSSWMSPWETKPMRGVGIPQPYAPLVQGPPHQVKNRLLPGKFLWAYPPTSLSCPCPGHSPLPLPFFPHHSPTLTKHTLSRSSVHTALMRSLYLPCSLESRTCDECSVQAESRMHLRVQSD